RCRGGPRARALAGQEGSGMIGYYLALAGRSLRRNVVLTILMIVAIAFGVGASMTTLTVLHVLSADPIPQKADRQAIMTGGNAGIDAQRPDLPPFFLDDIRQTTADFFPMFDVRFIAGTG